MSGNYRALGRPLGEDILHGRGRLNGGRQEDRPASARCRREKTRRCGSSHSTVPLMAWHRVGGGQRR